MDQLTHTVRRSNWINIIRQCQDRPAGTTAKQWLAENDISEKSYYYWLRKIRREVCEQEGLQEVTNPSALSFVEIPVKTARRHWRRSSGRILTWKAPQGPSAWKHRYSFPACIHSECKICELLCTAQSRAGVSTQWCKYLQTDHVELDYPVC